MNFFNYRKRWRRIRLAKKPLHPHRYFMKNTLIMLFCKVRNTGALLLVLEAIRQYT